jgi:hypothetical protein
VCIEPISTRFGSVAQPRSSGASKCGYGFIAARFYDSFTPAFET